MEDVRFSAGFGFGMTVALAFYVAGAPGWIVGTSFSATYVGVVMALAYLKKAG